MQESEAKDEFYEKQQNENSEKNLIHCNGKENSNPNANHNNKQRRNDEPSELSFEVCKFVDKILHFATFNEKILVPENAEEKAKRKLIENALKNPKTSIEEWREFAKTEYGLISGNYHKKINFCYECSAEKILKMK